MKINKLKESYVSQEYLKSILGYDLETGIFTWKIKSNSKVSIGDIAGSLNRYIFITINGYKYNAHRLAWLYVHGVWPSNHIDHRDRNKTNNRILNLRIVTHRENKQNVGLSSNNTSGCKGVSWDKSRQKYYSYITVNGILKNLGKFKKIKDAVNARKLAEFKYGFII